MRSWFLGAIAFLSLHAATATGTGLARPDDAPFQIDRWGIDEGLPVNGINALHFDRRGYLWIATFDGLVRFDGQRFVTFRPRDKPVPLGNRLIRLEAAADDRLWLLSEQGALGSFDGHRFRHHGRHDGLPDDLVLSLYMSGEGIPWAGTASGLAVYDGTRFRTLGDPRLHAPIRFIAAASGGRMLIATNDSVLVVQDGGVVDTWSMPETNADGRVPPGAAMDAEGGIWLALETGIWYRDRRGVVSRIDAREALAVQPLDTRVAFIGPRHSLLLHEGRLEASERPLHQATGREPLLLHAPDGSLWHNRIDSLSRNGEVALTPTCGIRDVAFDGSASAWVATACDGLFRVRRRSVERITHVAGQPLGGIYGLAQMADGTLWLASLDRGLAGVGPGGERLLAGDAHGIHGASLRTLHVDGLQRLWVGQHGLCRLDGDYCREPPGLPKGLSVGQTEVRALASQADGSLWVGSRGGLWQHTPDGRWHNEIGAAGLGRDSVVTALLPDPDGGLWIGTQAHGLRHRDAQGRYRRPADDSGLASPAVRALYRDGDGHLWIATEDRGLCRSRARATGPDVHFACLDRSRGLWSDSLHQILADDFDRLWFNSNQGVFTVARGDLVEALEGRRDSVYPQVFTARDGLPSTEGNGGVQGAGLRLLDGRLAFPSASGVGILDPRIPDQVPAGARVAIESIQLPDGRFLPPAPRVPLPLGERTLHIRFTGLSDDLVQPLYFRYRLHPEAPWIELTTQRQIILDHLGPGLHQMELLALSAEGRTGPVAGIEFDVPPWPHETRAFRYGGPVVLALAVALGWHRQRRTARLRQIGLEHMVAQRTRELRAQQDATARALETVSRQRNEIEALAAAKSRFFANISHELRTPLSLIAGPIQDMARGRPPSQELVGAMLNQTRRLRRLIDELLDLERIEAGALQLRRSHFDLLALLGQVTSEMAGLAQRAGITLVLEDGGHPVLPCHGDAEQLARVATNLVGNALKFTPRGGRVRVRALREAGRTGFRVEDSGPGIDAAWRDRIFDRFQLTGSEATRAREGTGIGLALCRELLRLHEGGIELGDSDLGGACFTAWLPERADIPAAAPVCIAVDTPPTDVANGHPDPRPQVEAGGGHDDGRQRPLVLVVEDQDDLRLYLAELLAGDYRVATAGNGAEALARIPSLLPDAILCDVVMPERDGLSLVGALRANGDLAGIPVLLLTARTGVDDQVTGLATGADHYLTKPFDSQVLRAHVAAMLATRHRLQAQLRRTAPAPAASPGSRRPVGARIDEALQALADRPETGVAELARAAHMSERTLRRHCQELFGMSPLERLRHHRLIRARGLLEQGAGSVSEVAYAVGYGNLAAFSRAYREHFGVAPSGHLKRGMPAAREAAADSPAGIR